MGPANAIPVNPVELLENAPMSSTQTRAVAIVTLISMTDGYDVLAVTFAAPGIARDWALGPAALGNVFASGLAGMAVGSLLLAPLADMVGRRPMVIFNLILMAIGLLMSALASTVGDLLAWRVVTGLGIGAMIPILTPLAVEYANTRRRGLALALMTIGYPLGGMAGGVIAAVLLHWFEWPAVFLLGAAASLVLLVLVMRWLPEPLTFPLARRNERSLDRVNAFLRRCGLVGVDALPLVSRKVPVPYRAIFTSSHLWATARITLVNMLYVMSVYYILSWLPKLTVDAGHSPAAASMVSACASLVGVAVGLIIGWAGDRALRPAIVASLMVGLGAAIPAFATGVHAFSIAKVFLLSAVLGAFLYGGTVCLYGLIVSTFAPHDRATGAGFVLGIGRASAALAPAIAGWLMEFGVGIGVVSLALGLPAVAAGLLVFFSEAENMAARPRAEFG